MIAHVTTAALASENKTLAHPASVHRVPTSANQEDHIPMAIFGARRLGEMVNNTGVIAGIEAMTAAQGMEFKCRLKSSPLIEAEFARVHERVSFLDAPLGSRRRLAASPLAHFSQPLVGNKWFSNRCQGLNRPTS
jgi:histidine ammonia-lyase